MSLRTGNDYRVGLSFGISLIIVISILAFLGIGLPIVQATTSSAALDGSASNGCGYVTVCSVSLSTSESNDIIVVGCDCWPSGTAFSVHDGAGLTFIPRESQLSIGGNQFIQTWYAVSASPLSSDQISVTTAKTGEIWYGVTAFAVSGGNTTNPFVQGFPISQANLNCAAPCNTGVSAPAGAFVFQIGGDTGSKLQTAGPGITLIQSSKSGQDVYAQYEVPAGGLSSATVSFGTAQGGDFGAIVDALYSAGSTLSGNIMGIDATAITYNNYDVNSISTNLMTIRPNNVIIVFVGIGTYPTGSGNPAPIVSSVTAAGLAFTQRQSSVVTPIMNGNHVDNEEWYAIANSPFSGPITVTASSEAGTIWMIAFGVYGANLASPFDTSPTLPTTQIGSDNNHAALSMTTTGSDTLVFAYEDMPSAIGYPQIGTGFNLVASDFGASLHYGDPAVEYQTYTSPQTSLQVGFINDYDAAGYAMIGDALIQAP
jgi:hypothetical protein